MAPPRGGPVARPSRARSSRIGRNGCGQSADRTIGLLLVIEPAHKGANVVLHRLDAHADCVDTVAPWLRRGTVHWNRRPRARSRVDRYRRAESCPSPRTGSGFPSHRRHSALGHPDRDRRHPAASEALRVSSDHPIFPLHAHSTIVVGLLGRHDALSRRPCALPRARHPPSARSPAPRPRLRLCAVSRTTFASALATFACVGTWAWASPAA